MFWHIRSAGDDKSELKLNFASGEICICTESADARAVAVNIIDKTLCPRALYAYDYDIITYTSFGGRLDVARARNTNARAAVAAVSRIEFHRVTVVYSDFIRERGVFHDGRRDVLCLRTGPGGNDNKSIIP